MSGPLFQHDGSLAAEEYLQRLVVAGPGRVRVSLPTWPAAGLILTIVVSGALMTIIGLVIAPEPLAALIPLGIAVAAAAAFIVGGSLMRVRVGERALCVGGHTIPWETVDPGRVALVSGPHLPGALGAHGASSSINGGSRALAVNGFQSVGTADGGAPGWVYRWYALGVRDRARLLRVIEEAMVAHGLSEAEGLTAAVFARGEVRTRGVTRPVLPDRAHLEPPLAPGSGTR